MELLQQSSTSSCISLKTLISLDPQSTTVRAKQPESLLIPSANQPGRRAQKWHDTYEQQAAQHHLGTSSFIITTVYNKLFPPSTIATGPEEIENNNDALDKIEQGTGQATRATFLTIIDPNTNLLLLAQTPSADLLYYPGQLKRLVRCGYF
jgi:hypothetical protein